MRKAASKPSIQPSMGILKLQQGEQKFKLTRHAPSSPELNYFVKHFWIIQWDLCERDEHVQAVIPNPCANLVVEPNQTAIYGVSSHKFTHRIEGKGSVCGVKFRPGGLYPFVQIPLSQLTNRSMPIHTITPITPSRIEAELLTIQDASKMAECAEFYLFPKLPSPDPSVMLVNQIVDYISTNQDLTRVDQVSDYFDINARQLQRLFNQYVGVPPKWVIKINRLQNAAESMDYNDYNDLINLSNDLGYYDQSHFIKDFKSIIGLTPDEYIKQRQPI
ncbi:helix-turn-helix domain-containing protein [Paenibacillus albiflavus]|nr:AraC family transcriptional regulator [Paenibacillus albiflavus]